MGCKRRLDFLGLKQPLGLEWLESRFTPNAGPFPANYLSQFQINQPPEQDRSTANNAIVLPSSMDMNISVNASIASFDDSDLYEWTPSRGGVAVVTLKTSSGQQLTIKELMTFAQPEGISFGYANEKRLVLPVQAGTKYQFEVTGGLLSANEAYNLGISLESETESRLLGPGKTVISFSKTDKIEHFRLGAGQSPAGRYVIHARPLSGFDSEHSQPPALVATAISSTGGDLAFGIPLYGASTAGSFGTTLEINNVGVSGETNFEPEIWIGANGVQAGPYEVWIARDDQDAIQRTLYLDDNETNSILSGNIDSPGDTDDFQIWNTSGHARQYRLVVMPNQSPGLHPVLLDQNKRPLSPIMRLEPNAAGNFQVLASASPSVGSYTPSGATGRYTLKVETLPEEGDTDPQVLALDAYSSGQFDYPEDTDNFRFEAPENGTFYVSIIPQEERFPFEADLEGGTPSSRVLNEFLPTAMVELARGESISLDAKYAASGAFPWTSPPRYRVLVSKTKPVDFAIDAILGNDKTSQVLDSTGIPLESKSQNIETAGDSDWYKLVFPQSGIYTITVNSLQNSTLDPRLVIRDDKGMEIARDDDSGKGVNAALSIQLESNKTYFAEITGYAGSKGEYSVALVPASAEETIADIPGIEAPLEIASPSFASSIGIPFDTDAFSITPPVSGILTARLKSSQDNFNPLLQAFTYENKKLPFAENDDYGLSQDSRVSFSVLAGKSVILLARGSGDSTGGYSLDWEIKPLSSIGGVDAPENIEAASAVPVITFPLKNSKIDNTITFPDDIDLFRYSPPSDGLVSFSQAPSEGSSLDPFLALLDDQGKELISDDDSGKGVESLTARYPVKAGNTYYLSARSSGGRSFGSYSLEADFRSLSADTNFSGERDEAPDFPDKWAPQIVFDGLSAGYVSGTISNQYGVPDIDTYRLMAGPEGGAIKIGTNGGDFLPDAPRLSPVITVLDSGNQTIRRVTFSGKDAPGSDVFYADPGSEYFIRIAGLAGSAGNYCISFSGVPDDAPNLSTSLYSPVLTTSIETKGNIDYPGDADSFSLRTPDSGRIGIQLVALPENSTGLVSGSLVIVDNFNRELSRAELIGGRSSIELDLKPGTKISVLVSGIGPSVFPYSIKAWESQGFSGDEAGDTYLTSTGMSLLAGVFCASKPDGQLASFQGRNDRDTWSLRIPTTGIYEVSATGSVYSLKASRMQGLSQPVITGEFMSRDGVIRGERFEARAGETVFIELSPISPGSRGIEPGPYTLDVSLAKAEKTPFVPKSVIDIGGTALDSSFSDNWLALQTHFAYSANGRDEAIAAKVCDNITRALAKSLTGPEAAKGAPFLVLWLDPVDFVLSEATGSKIGQTASSGTTNGFSNGNIASRGALDVVVIANPDVNASYQYPLSLVGVGGDRVLGGVALVSADGTITKSAHFDVEPKPREKLELQLFGEKPLKPPQITPDSPPPALAMSLLDPSLVSSLLVVQFVSNFSMLGSSTLELLSATASGIPETEFESALGNPFGGTSDTEADQSVVAVLVKSMEIIAIQFGTSLGAIGKVAMQVPGASESVQLLASPVISAAKSIASAGRSLGDSLSGIPFVDVLFGRKPLSKKAGATVPGTPLAPDNPKDVLPVEDGEDISPPALEKGLASIVFAYLLSRSNLYQGGGNKSPSGLRRKKSATT